MSWTHRNSDFFQLSDSYTPVMRNHFIISKAAIVAPVFFRNRRFLLENYSIYFIQSLLWNRHFVGNPSNRNWDNSHRPLQWNPNDSPSCEELCVLTLSITRVFLYLWIRAYGNTSFNRIQYNCCNTKMIENPRDLNLKFYFGKCWNKE